MSRSRRKTILVHHCFNPFLRDRANRLYLNRETHECSCSRHISLSDAQAYVQSDIALFCATRVRGPILLSQTAPGYSEIVMMGKGGRIAAHTVSAKDVERAYLYGQEKAQKHIEAFGEAMRETWKRLTATVAVA